MKTFSRILGLLVVLVLLALAFYAGNRTNFGFEKHEEENADLLLTQVKSAAKLITAEGYFSEVYDYKDYYKFDIGILRKKAIMRVKARVSVGYDMEKMTFTSYPEEKLIVISNIPQVEVLAIDHDLDYFDIQEGTFNSFSPEDYNKLQRRAKTFIENRAMDSRLVAQAEEQGNAVFALIRSMVESAGWTLQIESDPALRRLPG